MLPNRCTKINIIIKDVVHPEETIKAVVGWRYTGELKMVNPVNLWSSKKKKKKREKSDKLLKTTHTIYINYRVYS